MFQINKKIYGKRQYNNKMIILRMKICNKQKINKNY